MVLNGKTFDSGSMDGYRAIGEELAKMSVSNDRNTQFAYNNYPECEKNKIMNTLGVTDERELRQMFGIKEL